jgi:hypothetical protein
VRFGRLDAEYPLRFGRLGGSTICGWHRPAPRCAQHLQASRPVRSACWWVRMMLASRPSTADLQTTEPNPAALTDAPYASLDRPNSDMTLEDVKRILGAFDKVQHSVSAGEFVLGWCGRAQIEIRIHTTIDKQTRRLRPSGTDAIRIVLFDPASPEEDPSLGGNATQIGQSSTRSVSKGGRSRVIARVTQTLLSDMPAG